MEFKKIEMNMNDKSIYRFIKKGERFIGNRRYDSIDLSFAEITFKGKLNRIMIVIRQINSLDKNIRLCQFPTSKEEFIKIRNQMDRILENWN